MKKKNFTKGYLAFHAARSVNFRRKNWTILDILRGRPRWPWRVAGCFLELPRALARLPTGPPGPRDRPGQPTVRPGRPAARPASHYNTQEEEEEQQEDVSSPGRIVWVSWGRMRYPAKVVLLAEVPANLQSCLRKGGRNTVLVKFYGSGDYSRIEIRKLSVLGLTATDLKLASRSAQISQDYDAAQYDLRYGE